MKNNQKKLIVLENVKITYTDGKTDYFKAINITDEGVNTGRIIDNKDFIRGGFIPKENIKLIKWDSRRIINL